MSLKGQPGSRKAQAEFRQMWAKQEMQNFKQSFCKTKSWRRIDESKGVYRPLAVIIQKEGGDKAAARAGLHLASQCLLMGGPWVRFNPQTRRHDFLHLQSSFSNSFEECWSEYWQSTSGDATFVSTTNPESTVAPLLPMPTTSLPVAGLPVAGDEGGKTADDAATEGSTTKLAGGSSMDNDQGQQNQETRRAENKNKHFQTNKCNVSLFRHRFSIWFRVWCWWAVLLSGIPRRRFHQGLVQQGLGRIRPGALSS